MRGLWLVSLLVLASGCSDRPGEEGAGDAPEDDGDPVAQGNGTGPVALDVQEHTSRFTASVHPPPATGDPLEQQVGGEPFEFTVGDEVEGLFIEMTWDGTPRAELRLRAVSDGDRYYYGGTGAGTPDDPDTLFIEHPEPGYSVMPVADTAAADQEYTIYVTFFDRPALPDGYTAVPQA